ncbi:prefoldin subunit 6 [Trichomonascus vanleenenianus]|uniref:tubulin-binding prefolding complex subunit YKE2 n=1 Tax=Trichomonascus vanleenenianus TaxID=2268995 RepID=UPI003ECAD3E8
MSEAQKKFQKANEEFNAIQQEYSGYVASRQQLETQLQENKIVKEEFDTLKDDGAKIYKLIGPVMVPQEHVEAKTNVAKRLEFIEGEIKRVEGQMSATQKKLQDKRDELIKLQDEATA